MIVGIIVLIMSICLCVYRFVKAREGIYTFKGKILEDRFMEIIIGIILSVVAILNLFVYIGQGFTTALINSLPILGMLALAFAITAVEYNRVKVGLYKTGIVFKSFFIDWKRIYTFRSYDLSNGNIKITFFIHETFNQKRLWKLSVETDPSTGEELERILNTKLDRSRN